MDHNSKYLSIRYQARALGEKKGEIKVYSVIDTWKWGPNDPTVTSDDFDKELAALGDIDELTVRINSPGGIVSEAIAIRTALMKHKARKTIDIEGCCDSAATLIACLPGAKVRMAKGSEYMIHKCRGRASGTDDDMMSAYLSLKQTNEDMADIYAEKTGKTREECLELMRAETWYGADSAKENGFVDMILTGEEEAPIVACAVQEDVMNLMRQMYAHVPERDLIHVSQGKSAVADRPAENKNEGVRTMELKEATVEMLMQENPALVQSIAEKAAKEALAAERERCQQIDDMTPPGASWESIAAKAKADGTSYTDYAKLIAAAQRKQKDAYLDNREKETAAAKNVGGGDAHDHDDDAESQGDKAAAEIAKIAEGVSVSCMEI